MKNNRLRFGLALIILLYGGFMTYYCVGNPCESNNILIEQERLPENAKDLECVETNNRAEMESRNVENRETFELDSRKTDEQKESKATAVGPVYLSEITAFYERVITILSITIGIILVLSFAYVHLTSKIQAEDMASDALKTESFGIILKNRIATGADEFIEMYSGIPELEKRIEFLVNQANKQSYELSDLDLGELSDGNN